MKRPRLAGTIAGVVGLALATAPASAAAAVALAQIGTFSSPVYVAAPPGDTSRVFVVEQPGTIRIVKDGATLPAPFLDISSRITFGGERGLLSIAFAPDYPASGTFYVYFTGKAGATADNNGDVVIARMHASSPESADPASLQALLRIPHDRQANHNGGQLQIGPGGNLWAATGDGGSAGDPAGNGQNLTSSDPAVVGGANHNPLLGKLLRITPQAAGGYNVPAGNPFPAPATEVFAYGLRNPWRFSFDRQTGDLVIADVGQGAYEEIDFAPAPDWKAGANWGWNIYEGNHVFQGVPAPGQTYSFPVVEHTHSDGWCSITGGYVVRDPNLPELAGEYVYGDYCKGQIWGVKLATAGASGDHNLGLPTVANMSSFGEDACGRVYVTSLDGPVYRLSSSGECSGAVPPPSDALHATVSSVSRQRSLRTGRVRVRVHCNIQCDARATGKLLIARRAAASKPLLLRSAHTVVAAGATVALDLRFSRSVRRAALRALRRGRRVTASVLVTARHDGGPSVRKRVRIRIVRR